MDTRRRAPTEEFHRSLIRHPGRRAGRTDSAPRRPGSEEDLTSWLRVTGIPLSCGVWRSNRQPFSPSTPPVPSRGGTRDRRASSGTSCGYSPHPDARRLTVWSSLAIYRIRRSGLWCRTQAARSSPSMPGRTTSVITKRIRGKCSLNRFQASSPSRAHRTQYSSRSRLFSTRCRRVSSSSTSKMTSGRVGVRTASVKDDAPGRSLRGWAEKHANAPGPLGVLTVALAE